MYLFLGVALAPKKQDPGFLYSCGFNLQSSVWLLMFLVSMCPGSAFERLSGSACAASACQSSAQTVASCSLPDQRIWSGAEESVTSQENDDEWSTDDDSQVVSPASGEDLLIRAVHNAARDHEVLWPEREWFYPKFCPKLPPVVEQDVVVAKRRVVRRIVSFLLCHRVPR